MKKIFYVLALFVLPQISLAQYKLDVGVGLGAANILGDIGGKEKPRQDFVRDIQMSQTRYDFSAFARYKWRPAISFKGNVSYFQLQGSDALSTNPARFSRNLSFRNRLLEVAGTAEWYFYKSSDMSGRPGLRGSRKRVDFRTYLYAGGALVMHNPKAELGGTWYSLRDYQTENVSYGRFTFAIPMGLGMTYTINRHYRLGLEFGWRKTFTDYLDDISTDYPKLLNSTDPIAAQLSNRNPELGASTTVAPENYGYSADFNGSNLNKRGDPTNNDNYLTAQLTFSYVLKGKNKFYKQKYKSLSQRRKVVKRKTRAKF